MPKDFAPLDRAECIALAAALPDTPETIITRHQLKAGVNRAYVVGDPSHFRAAVVTNTDMPDDPWGFGDDAEALWSILKTLPAWHGVTVSERVAEPLGALIERGAGVKVRYDGDLYFILEKSAPEISHPAVLRLTVDDLAMVKRAAPELRVTGMGSPEAMLRDGIAVGAVYDGRLVANAHTSARSALYADIGVYTIEEYRGQGLGAAVAAMLANLIRQAGQTPVWSCGEDNAGSLRIAHKLGFAEVSRRVYIIRK